MATIVIRDNAIMDSDHDSSELSDSLLLDGLRHGDRAAFDRLFLRYYGRVYGVLLRLVRRQEEAEDLAQDVFVKLYRQPPGAGREHNLGAWLYRVAMNAGQNALRADQRQMIRLQRAAVLEPRDGGVEPAKAAIAGEEQELVRRVLATLPSNYQTALALRYEGFSYQEIAEVLGIGANAIGTVLARAEKQFRDRYLQMCPAPANKECEAIKEQEASNEVL